MIHNSFKVKLWQGKVDIENDTIKMAVMGTGHSIDIDTQEFWSDVSANEISDSGYTAGGQQTTTVSVTQDNTADEAPLDFDDITWTLTGPVTSRYGVLYKDTGTPSTSPLIDSFDFGSDKTTENGDLTIQVDSDGYATIS